MKYFTLSGEVYDRVPFDGEDNPARFQYRCECGAEEGDYCDPGCPWEVCPRCWLVFSKCKCEATECPMYTIETIRELSDGLRELVAVYGDEDQE